MRPHWETLARFERLGFEIVVQKTWEDCDVADLFDDTCYDIEEMRNKINSGHLDWFMLRARVMVDDLVIAEDSIGGLLYEDAHEVLTDGTAEDVIHEALTEAKKQVYHLSKRFAAISEEVDRAPA